MLRTQYEWYLGAAPLRLECIIVVQRGDEGNVVGERVDEWVGVKAGTSLIHSQSSCAGGEGMGDDRKAMRERR